MPSEFDFRRHFLCRKCLVKKRDDHKIKPFRIGSPLRRCTRHCARRRIPDGTHRAGLLARDIDMMEITFRTAAAKDSTAAVVKESPEMPVGAGARVQR